MGQLPLMEAYSTIQGEGFHQGKAAYFIRLAGCDVGCTWCDVKGSWDAGAYPQTPVTEIVAEASRQPSDLVVITGGEPLMYDLDRLTNSLREQGYKTHLETSGAYPLTGEWDWITLSPKKFKAPLPAILTKAHELKIIVCNASDFLWAEQYAEQVNPDCQLYLQPEWDRSDKMLPSIITFVQGHPEWRISIQLHKYIGVD